MANNERESLLSERESGATDTLVPTESAEPPLAVRVAAVAFNFAITGIWSGAIGVRSAMLVEMI